MQAIKSAFLFLSLYFLSLTFHNLLLMYHYISLYPSLHRHYTISSSIYFEVSSQLCIHMARLGHKQRHLRYSPGDHPEREREPGASSQDERGPVIHPKSIYGVINFANPVRPDRVRSSQIRSCQVLYIKRDHDV